VGTPAVWGWPVVPPYLSPSPDATVFRGG